MHAPVASARGRAQPAQSKKERTAAPTSITTTRWLTSTSQAPTE